jgi:hypothetical protein
MCSTVTLPERRALLALDGPSTRQMLQCGTWELQDVKVSLWPNADVKTRLSIRPLNGVKQTCNGHARIFRV